jgi:hypothetical protein
MANRQTNDFIREFQVLPAQHELVELHWQPVITKDPKPMDDPATLGLNYEWYGRLATSHFVGAVHIPINDDQSVTLKVFPKGNDQNMAVDYLEMFFTCLGQPTISGQLGHCLYFWPAQNPIKGFSEAPKFSIMIVAMFLRELEQFCRRHLRKDFHHTRQNLTGKVKGRILFREQLAENVLRGRPDRFFCQYQVLSRDSIENRILRAALSQAKRCLSRQSYLLRESGTSVWGWASTSDAALAGVPLVRVADTDFNRVKIGGLKKAYRRPLYWAQKVLKLLGSDPNTDALPASDELPPFAIDMNELFERYCQALLIHEYGTNLWSGYHNINLGNVIKVRPDFIVKGEQIVLDAKYKYEWEDPGKALDYMRSDIYQIMAYTRHQTVANMACKNHDTGKGSFEKAIILYPYIQANPEVIVLGGEEIICKDDFPLLYKIKVVLPITQ